MIALVNTPMPLEIEPAHMFITGGTVMDPILTIAEASRLIAEKKLSPVELTEDCLARVKADDDTLHAFILLTEERALADARAAEAR